MAEGTVIQVEDLFYNLPARRKFLKSDAAESAQVSRVVTQLALCYPEVGFTLTSSGRKVLACPPVAGLRERLYQLYGERADLVHVSRPGDVAIEGYVAALAEQGPTRGPQHVFVNRRIVKDRTIAHAIIDAVLGAAGMGDLGTHFPPEDERWHDANSLDLLRTAVGMLRGRVVNADATVVCEEPRLAVQRPEMERLLAEAAGGPVSVKATTNEGMGWIGRGEGVACIAVALIDVD